MEQGQINEERVEQVYVMKECACITRNRSVGADGRCAGHQFGFAMRSQRILSSVPMVCRDGTIAYASRQAVGMANDHGAGCFGCPFCRETHRGK